MTKKTRVACVALLTVSVCGIASAATNNVTLSVAGRLGYNSIDQELNGAKFNEEAGPLIGVEGTLGIKPSEMLTLEARGALDFVAEEGTIYSGAQGGYGDTEYTQNQIKFKGEGVAGLVLGNADASLTPFAGLGLRVWSWGEPDPEFLYIESWSAVYGVVGVRGDAKLGQSKLYGRVAVQIPFKETVSVEGYEEDLEDGTTSMVEAELGLIAGRLVLALWGEWFTYSDDYESYQSSFGEDITVTAVGAKIGVAF